MVNIFYFHTNPFTKKDYKFVKIKKYNFSISYRTKLNFILLLCVKIMWPLVINIFKQLSNTNNICKKKLSMIKYIRSRGSLKFIFRNFHKWKNLKMSITLNRKQRIEKYKTNPLNPPNVPQARQCKKNNC